ARALTTAGDAPRVPATVGVIGAGQMGIGIAQVAAQAGLQVHVVDTSDAILKRQLDFMEGMLRRSVEKGRLSAAEGEAVRRRVASGTSLESLSACDFVIEAIVEDVAVKRS